ncbi:FecCD family ABC transporter permease [methane-oxidizing endosymbiont of Gigantopelta aegis]|uniref:FecCD family ABC transporter permease n=1 Tax=methane-oxidizing endosymbiont of Gigantopelta aegis TaxID=2794938 RepID=UPI0018DB1C88|nr:iron ABC transporter permease [methane-oxidizing endosymbiont of Gigantopelta aegis]
MDKQLPLFLFLIGLLTVCFIGSLLVGPSAVGWLEWWQWFNDASQLPVDVRLILLEIRLPRALLGLMVGMTLGLSGAALQGYLRNPLAEPGLIGVSSAASLGAVITIYTGIASTFALALPLGGIAGGLLSVISLLLLAGKTVSVLRLILAGIAITSFASALTSLALNMAPNPFVALEIMFWLMGSLADRSFEHVSLSLPFMILGWALLLLMGRSLDALTLGEEAAQTMGVSLSRLRLLTVIGVALSVGAATAVSGAIGFVGLIVPHLLRRWVGFQPGRLLWASALGGASLVLIADIAVRLLSSATELKLGVLTAMIGAPFFLMLIFKTEREVL